MDDHSSIAEFLRRISEIQKNCETSSGEDIVEMATAFILTRSDKELSNLKLKDAAEAVGRDSALLANEFELGQNITFEKFVLREKVHRAIYALEQEEDITISNLARRLGFTTTYDFSFAFEKYFLICPRRYKKIIKTRKRDIWQ